MTKLPHIKEDFSGWYNEVIYQAELADQSPVRGSMVIRPYGYALWENIKTILDARIKATGHCNAAFPLLIPESFLKREASHVEGFAPELAVVTHAGGKKLEEPLVIRPTSETIIHYMFARWIASWRDLPLKINQWANVVRWEMRTRPFIRTTEIFWQEGHTAHETKQEAQDEAVNMLNEYVKLAQDYLAIPVITGKKTAKEKFPGAEITYTFEALMQDGRALQMGTSHVLSPSFAQAFEMNFQDRDGKLALPHLTSWAVTTRLIGAVVMVHGDKKGLILPPRIAPIQIVIVPIMKKDHDNQRVIDYVQTIETILKKQGIRVYVDADDTKTPGFKFYHWELKGVPIRLEIGPRDVEKNQIVVVERLHGTKQFVSTDQIAKVLLQMLDILQSDLFTRAKNHQQEMWHKASKLAQFSSLLQKHNGLYQTGWCGKQVCENTLKEYQATTRCILPQKIHEFCFNCEQHSIADVLIAKAY